MSDIPDDIMEAAVAVVDSLGFETGGPIQDEIARAILAERLAERERCANVAEDFTSDGNPKPTIMGAIAAVIRGAL